MTNLDDKILKAIQANTIESLENYSEDLGLFGLVRESFRGSLKWVVAIAFALIFIFIGLTVYCGYNFLYAADTSIKLNWMTATIISAIIVTVLRLWYFMELNRLSAKRDIKRVELQLALLINKLDGVE